ncbi:MAG: hypothetical protein M3346_06110 [Actinomycetota bacterium]|nr:hypothetical protein [Actinomycetota bacterium]
MIVRLERPRIADRSWMEEFDDLSEQGFVWRCDRSDWETARSSVCTRCGEDMDFRGFERGDVAYRAYALCVMCGWWLEF